MELEAKLEMVMATCDSLRIENRPPPTDPPSPNLKILETNPGKNLVDRKGILEAGLSPLRSLITRLRTIPRNALAAATWGTYIFSDPRQRYFSIRIPDFKLV